MGNNVHHLSRRERQIMDIIYAHNEATASEVHAALPDPPSYSSIRALLRILEEKSHLKHRKDGVRYVYMPTETRSKASRSALKRVVKTFFEGSAPSAVAALVDTEGKKLSKEEWARIETIIRNAKAKSK